jgi:hypothetical protein
VLSVLSRSNIREKVRRCSLRCCTNTLFLFFRCHKKQVSVCHKAHSAPYANPKARQATLATLNFHIFPYANTLLPAPPPQSCHDVFALLPPGVPRPLAVLVQCTRPPANLAMAGSGRFSAYLRHVSCLQGDTLLHATTPFSVSSYPGRNAFAVIS